MVIMIRVSFFSTFVPIVVGAVTGSVINTLYTTPWLEERKKIKEIEGIEAMETTEEDIHRIWKDLDHKQE